jgi:putative Ig domain-containing protein
MVREPYTRFAKARRRLSPVAEASQWVVAPLCISAFHLPMGCGSGSSSSATTPATTPPILSVATTTLEGGTVTVSHSSTFSSTLTATGGTGTGYTWTLSTGVLPRGLSLSRGGLRLGTSTAQGSFNFTVGVTASAGSSSSANLNLEIGTAGPLTSFEFTGDDSPVHDPSTYYAVSSFGSNFSAIGLVTNTTLDSTGPSYNCDQVLILQSSSSGDFNATDPNILVHAGNRYGSSTEVFGRKSTNSR